MKNKKRVAIIGSGPAGLLACHAAIVSGLQPTMYSPDNRPPRLHGAQYLHSFIPELQMPPPFFISYKYFGDQEGYANKIYGDPKASCSWGRFGNEVIAWNLDSIVVDLWHQYSMLVKEWVVQPNDVDKMVANFDYVLSTAPLHAIAPMGEYEVEHVWIATDNWYDMPPNSIHYFGDDRPEYRRSYIMGKRQVEYPDSMEPPVPDAVRIPKPVVARAQVQGVHLLGRYGQWKKGVLVDHVFHQAMEIFKGKRHWRESQVS